MPRLVALLCLAAALAGCDSAQRSPPAEAGTAVIDTTVDPSINVLAIPPGQAFDALVARIHDGDSFDLALRQDGQRIGVRISGIDAPERRQPYADVSRRHLQTLIAKQRIRIHVLGHDRYGRILGQVKVPASKVGEPGLDVGLAQLEAGLAWYYRRYEKDLPATWRGRYDDAETAARQQGRGLWREPSPVEPWRYREARRNPGRAGQAPP